MTDNGPSDAATGPGEVVTVVDTLPDGETYHSATGTGWLCTDTAATVTCTMAGPFAAGSTATINVSVDVAPDAAAGSPLTNTATVASPTDDPDPANNTATDPTAIGSLVDLAVVKTHTGTVAIGAPLTFGLAVRNNGPSVASGVTVTDTLPAGLTYENDTGTDPAWTVTAASPAADGTTAVTATLAGTLSPGADAPALQITTTVTSHAYPAVTNTVTVSSTQPDSDPGNNASADHVTVPPRATLVLHKVAVGAFTVGADGHYLITVTNQGPTEDPGPVVVTDPLPKGLTYRSATSSAAACKHAGQKVSCTVNGALAVHATVTIALTVRVGQDAYPQVVNVATVTSPSTAGDHDGAGVENTVAAAQAPVASRPGGLANTGTSVARSLIVGVTALIVGGALLALGRRRRRPLA